MSITRKKDYQGKVKAGYAAMKGRKVAICGLARDCALGLPGNIKTIERLRKHFQASYAVVVENDSRDRTKEILKNWSAARKDVFVLSQDTGELTTPAQSPGQVRPWFSKHRIERFVKFRNMYLDFVEKNLAVDTLIVLDLDIFSFSIDGIAHTFGQPIGWHAVTANGRNIPAGRAFFKGYNYYDTYALWESADTRPQTEEMIFGYQNIYKGLKRGMPMVRVASAFNGLAVYQMEAVKGLRYRCLSNQDPHVEAVCDHVSLHKQMAERGQDLIYMNPSQIVMYDTYAHWLYRNSRRFAGQARGRLYAALFAIFTAVKNKRASS
ncbi:MAG TPA: hypothetical protein PK470_06500 [Candidatus Omnitrophota bacterium]|nr:hypothetical protein [Candidatus Omnitrophota bacterium]